jgi:SAM-dependent methyltransferase
VKPEAQQEARAAAAATSAEATSTYIAGWATGNGSRAYVQSHLTRLEKTLAITPRGGPEDRVLEMGAYLQITPALKTRLGYGEVRGCYYGPAGQVEHRTVTSESGEAFECEIDLFDAEKDCFPYPDQSFSTVLCCELLEHLAADPMHMMHEVNRILKPGGSLVLTTPNLASLRSLAAFCKASTRSCSAPSFARAMASSMRATPENTLATNWASCSRIRALT